MKMSELEPDKNSEDSPSIASIFDNIRKSTTRITREVMDIENQILDWFDKYDRK